MDDYITRNEAAQLLNVTLATIDRWARQGLIKRYKIRGNRQSVRFSKQELLEFAQPKEMT